MLNKTSLISFLNRDIDVSTKDALNISEANAVDLRRLARANLPAHIPVFALLIHLHPTSFFATQYQSTTALFFGVADFLQEELREELLPKERHLVAVKIDLQAWNDDVVGMRVLAQKLRFDGSPSVKRSTCTDPIDDFKLLLNPLSHLRAQVCCRNHSDNVVFSM